MPALENKKKPAQGADLTLGRQFSGVIRI